MERNKITYGGRTFTHNEIKNLRCYMAASLLSTSLESNTLGFDIESTDNSLTEFKQNDKLVYSYNGNVIGNFYVQSVKRIGATRYRFSAVSAIGILAQKIHAGGIYTGNTVSDVIADICGSIPFVVKSNLQSVKLYGWLPYRNDPPNISARDNLAQVLFAIGATVKTDLDGVLHIESIWNGMSGAIAKDVIYSGPSVKYGSSYSAVAVLEHQYSAGSEQKTLFEGTAQDGDIIVFDEPMHSLSASGFSILSSGSNYAILSSGAGTLSGKRYTHNTRRIAKTINSQVTENVKEIKNATLVSVVNSAAVVERMVAYYKCAETINEKIVLGSQKPGDVVCAYHPYDKSDVSACMKSVNINASGILAANVEALVGFEPQDMVNIEYYDRRELISESGTFTIPDGVKTIRAVLIGGGSGGSGGGNGTSGTAGGSASISKSQNGTSTGTKGSAGDGGEKGIAGSGGKISILDLEVVPGSVMSFIIGQGGAGGSAGGNAGSSGGETTLTVDGTVHSSNEGSASSGGYVDTTTGEVFAQPGQEGVAGEKGGSAGDINNAGSAGGSVGQNAGGAGNSSAAIIDRGSVKGNWVYDRHNISYGSYSGYFSAESFTGYSGYTTDRNGRLKYSGSKITIGVVNGSVVTGRIYIDLYTDPTMDSGGYLADRIEEITVESGDTSYRCYRKQRSLWSEIYYKRSTAQYIKAILPAGGGGAAEGASGSNATSSCSGGNGASASAPSAPTTYGAGGNGGNGGGGGGAGGAGYAQIEGNDSSVGLSARQNGGSGGSGGSGSAGSKGANGCAILYFGEPHVLPHGAVMDKQGRFAIDRAGRLMVV